MTLSDYDLENERLREKITRLLDSPSGGIDHLAANALRAYAEAVSRERDTYRMALAYLAGQEATDAAYVVIDALADDVNDAMAEVESTSTAAKITDRANEILSARIVLLEAVAEAAENVKYAASFIEADPDEFSMQLQQLRDALHDLATTDGGGT